PFQAHPLVVLAILSGFRRAGPRRILFGFGDCLLDFWGIAKARGRDKRDVPPHALRRHGKSFPDAPLGARIFTPSVPIRSEKLEFEIGPGALRWRLDQL